MTDQGGMRELLTRLDEAGRMPPGWREAYWRVPRHLFIPEVVWRENCDGDYLSFSRGEDPRRWWTKVYADELIVTQVDDGRAPGTLGYGSSSSASMPSLVFWMLDQLDVDGGQRVLEIGTGTGYSAALLSAKLGDRNVITVEVDADLAAAATKALADAGWHPTVVAADGAGGYTPRAPYDRVIATCAVRHVPYSWVTQTRPSGLIVTPWGTAYTNNALTRLRVHADGTASGRFLGGLAFMRLRSQRTTWGHVDEFVHHEGDADATETDADLWDMTEEHADFAVSLLVPDCQYVIDVPDDSGSFTIWLGAQDRLSWSRLDYEPGMETYPVRQYGPRRVWDEVEVAYRWWIDAGRPERERFGLTVTPEGQHVWLDEPGRTVTPVS